MKLYYAPGACSLAPHIVLEWLGVPYELEKAGFGTTEYLKINPMGAVPALTDGDQAPMAQNGAILKYLAAKYPEADLGDDGTARGKYELDHWLSFLGSDFHPAFFPYFVPDRFTASQDEGARDAVRHASLKLIEKVMTRLDVHLRERDYILRPKKTVVDAYAFAMCRWAAKLPRPISSYESLSLHFDLLGKDAGVRRALEQEGLS